MSESIVPTQTLIPGVELIYLDDRDVAGIHISGLARLLNCDPKTVQRVVETMTLDDTLEAEILTPQGIRTVTWISKDKLIQVLIRIMQSDRIKVEVKNKAKALFNQWFSLEEISVPQPKQKQRKFLYLIQCVETKVFKIGISGNPIQRLRCLQTAYPFPLAIIRQVKVKDAQRLEGVLHKKLNDFRLNGEWFDGVCLQFIGDIN